MIKKCEGVNPTWWDDTYTFAEAFDALHRVWGTGGVYKCYLSLFNIPYNVEAIHIAWICFKAFSHLS